MASYVISDIHGEYQKFIQLLNKINLTPDDTLYILGDMIDRGRESMKVLFKLMSMPNVVPIAGNHEYMALRCLHLVNQELTDDFIDSLDSAKMERFLEWISNGGKETLNDFSKLSPEQRSMVLDYLETFELYCEVVVENKHYILVHAGLDNFQENRPLDSYDLSELVFIPADYTKEYFPDKYLITGHTPTVAIPDNPRPGYIFRNKNHIAIDCGAYFTHRLAAFCLDTEEEFYVV